MYTNQTPLIEATDISKSYLVGSQTVKVLQSVTIQINPGEFMAIVGRSGSGKTTLLNLLAGLDQPNTGKVLVRGVDIADMSDNQLTDMRRGMIGFIFQSFGLLPLLSAFENVELPLRIAGVNIADRQSQTRDALEMVGLWSRASHRPYELSGGEQQRVSIARAIVNKPPLILADEPTGELDSNNARDIFGLFKEMISIQGMSIVCATHDSTLLSMADNVKELRNGSLVTDYSGENVPRFRK
ncbi:MAG: ABC transporter ATP-binding protein [Chloroflexota bacterium]|nr:ABC transporter ATP-binding protein [Chloroflexota bacterium]